MALFTELSTALRWITDQQPAEIVLGLDRVKVVAERLQLLSFTCPIIIVGGTNGKGTTVAALEAIYLSAGYQVGAFTSPILFKHNEYVRLNGKAASDDQFCRAYEQIAQAKDPLLLTPFEFHTLAALIMFKQAELDVVILEVGLGGRLDAVNIMDADVAIVTSIDIDHADWLGDTREKIALEKAGIFRQGKPAICGEVNPPATLLDYAKKIGAVWYCLEDKEQDCVKRNKACARIAVDLLQDKLPVSQQVIDDALAKLTVTGRVQVVQGEVTKIYDVSHNPAAVSYLAKRLLGMPSLGKTFAVFSMLSDKDIAESVRRITPLIDEWHIAPLTVNRGATKEQLLNALTGSGAKEIFLYDSIQAAYLAAEKKAIKNDRIVVFGSFHTVSAVLSA